jgi:Na+-transporting NADH:ubiquinone oxidoreductase subunit C
MTSKPWFIVSFMVAVALVFGGGVTGIYLGAADLLQRNTEFLRQRALVAVFDLGDPARLSKAQVADIVKAQVVGDERCTDPETGSSFELLKAYAAADRKVLKAYGFQFRGLGFWGPLRGILAVSPDLSRTVGLTILEHTETPGLGGRIEEPIFTEQFRRGITVSPNGSAPFIHIGSPGVADPTGRQVDAITGATQTCLAVQRVLNTQLGILHRAMAARRTSTATGSL